MVDEEYNKLLKQFHRLSDRHILILETDMSSSYVQRVVALSDKIRKAEHLQTSLMRCRNNIMLPGIFAGLL